MFVPAAVLVVLGLAVGVWPHFHEQVRAAAFTMADHAGYQARVLDGAALPDLAPAAEVSPLAGSLARSFGATAVALAIAFLALAPWYPRQKRSYRPLRVSMQFLRNFHTGHVGDYVAFLTFGAAAFGVTLALLVRYLHP
jgi:multicomponent Na+:H+ antiporter subunit D